MGRRPHRRPQRAIAILLFSWGWGCGDGSVSVSGSGEEATVKGTVTIEGKPATGGEVIFDPANVRRRDAPSKRAKIEKDGSFEIKTLVGENAAIVEGAEVKAAGLVMRNRKHVEVKSGENSMTISIP